MPLTRESHPLRTMKNRPSGLFFFDLWGCSEVAVACTPTPDRTGRQMLGGPGATRCPTHTAPQRHSVHFVHRRA